LFNQDIDKLLSKMIECFSNQHTLINRHDLHNICWAFIIFEGVERIHINYSDDSGQETYVTMPIIALLLTNVMMSVIQCLCTRVLFKIIEERKT